MRIYRMRFDIWLCVLISYLLSEGSVWVINRIMPATYDTYVEQHTIEEGEIGGIADESVFRAQSVEDLLSHDTFTILSEGMAYSNRGGGYYKSWYMDAVELPSGERVAIVINGDSVKHMGDDIFSGETILPVGRVVYEDLTQDEYFINQIEYAEPLSRTDFYVDMKGEGGTVSQTNYVKDTATIVQLLVFFLSFPILHGIGAKLGIFPYFFPPRDKKKAEWD